MPDNWLKHAAARVLLARNNHSHKFRAVDQITKKDFDGFVS